MEENIGRKIVETSTKERLISFLTRFKFPLIALAVVLIIVAITAGILFSINHKKVSETSISGTINYTALKPDPTDRGEIQIRYRTYGTNENFAIAVINHSVYSTSWMWNKAQSGKPYEIIADLVIDGKLVTSSEPLIVTAPAYNQLLSIRVTWHDLPESVVKEQTASIKGMVSINGYIPNDSSLLIQTKSDSNNTVQTVVTIPSPKQQNDWTWENTVPLKDYQMQAVLMEGTTQIGETELETAAGGDTAINFTINSSAIPPQSQGKTTIGQNKPTLSTSSQAKEGSITGTVMINGPEQENTSLLMLWRNPGDKDYKVITRINNPSHNGQAWNWNNQPTGKRYEITAVLQVNQQNSASTQSQIVAVPAQNVNFTLNTGVNIPTPDGKVSTNSCNSIGNNQYNATISFPRVSNAGKYWIQVGRSAGGSDVYNAKIQASSGNPQITVQIDANRSYYGQYAYALCSICNEDANFSNFSQSIAFSCGGGAAYTGYVCSSNFSCQLTTDNNPPYAFNNAGLTKCQQDCHAPTPSPKPTVTNTPSPQPTATPTTQPTAGCNETCGSNGYICRDNLSCTDQGGGMGSSVCRNPSCPDDESCSCLPQ